MFGQIGVIHDVMGGIPGGPSKTLKLTASKLNANTIMMANNNATGHVFGTQGNSATFSPNGGLWFYSFLRPEYNSDTGTCIIGNNTSNDSLENYASAQLSINYSNGIPAGASLPTENPHGYFCWTAYINGTGFYLDLKANSGGCRYCHIKVNTLPTNSQRALIEGNVFINIAVSDYRNGPNPNGFTIYSTNPIVDGGSDISNVVNKDIYLDLNATSNAYLTPMIGVTRVDDQHFKFEVGDPKDDADIDVEEV